LQAGYAHPVQRTVLDPPSETGFETYWDPLLRPASQDFDIATLGEHAGKSSSQQAVLCSDKDARLDRMAWGEPVQPIPISCAVPVPIGVTVRLSVAVRPRLPIAIRADHGLERGLDRGSCALLDLQTPPRGHAHKTESFPTPNFLTEGLDESQTINLDDEFPTPLLQHNTPNCPSIFAISQPRTRLVDFPLDRRNLL